MSGGPVTGSATGSTFGDTLKAPGLDVNTAAGTVRFGTASDVTLARDAGVALKVTAGTPAIGACGTSPTLAGNNNVMLLTVGTGGVATSCAATFSGTWATAPVCVGQSSAAADALGVVTTTTTVTLTKATALTASSTIAVLCLGR